VTQALLDYAMREYRSFRALGVSDPHARTSATINAARQFQVSRETARTLLNAALTERHNGGALNAAQFLGG
jgi:hypothetical protein